MWESALGDLLRKSVGRTTQSLQQRILRCNTNRMIYFCMGVAQPHSKQLCFSILGYISGLVRVCKAE